MAHGVSEVLGEGSTVVKMVTNKQQQQQQQQPQHGHLQQQQQPQQSLRKSVGVMGSRRIFAPAFKLKVLDSYRNDIDCRGNQRATARKYGIHRRQIQKWLQCEDNLRSCCAEGAATSGIATPACSPQKDLVEPVPHLPHNHLHQQQQQQQQQPQQQHRQAHNGTPASPALNLSLARLHGDELAVQQQQPPPPPLPPPPSAVAAQALATQQQQQQQHQHQQANYRFHGAAAVAAAAAAAATGYPDLKDKAPIQQQQQQQQQQPHHYSAQSSTDYNVLELYQPLATYHHHHQPQQLSTPPSHHNHQRYEPPTVAADLHHRHQRAGNFPHTFEAKVESTSSSSSSSSSPSSTSSSLSSTSSASFSPSSSLPLDDESQQQQRHCHQERNCGSVLLLAPTEIKTERASPDSAATPVPHVHSSDSESRQPRSRNNSLKRERLDEEEQLHPKLRQQLEEREAVPLSRGSGTSSPTSSHQDPVDSLESLPPSPRDSERSTASSSDSEMDYSLGGGQHPVADLARRRSFSLRFKLDVLDAFHRDAGVAGNQRATARKFGINRRQVQKWLGQENDLRGVIELCGSNNRQRLGPVHEGPGGPAEETPVDLRTGCADLGQLSPRYGCCEYLDSSLTPPYSAPGCSLSCCQEPTSGQSYYCYSPPEPELVSATKRPACTRSCCYPSGPPSKRPCILAPEDDELQRQPMQETPLCLVKPKRHCTVAETSEGQEQLEVSSTVPTPPAAAVQPPPPAPASKKDAILFKPYLDNPVSKPSAEDASGFGNNNNCQETCNLNERTTSHDLALELSFRLPVSWRGQPQQQQQQHRHQQQQQQPQQQHQQQQQHHSQYLEFPQVRSAFVRYPASAHYS